MRLRLRPGVHVGLLAGRHDVYTDVGCKVDCHRCVAVVMVDIVDSGDEGCCPRCVEVD